MPRRTPRIVLPPCPPPNHHWHVCWSHKGHQTWQQWHGTPLIEEERLYLKGGSAGPQGDFYSKGAGAMGARARARARTKAGERRCLYDA